MLKIPKTKRESIASFFFFLSFSRFVSKLNSSILFASSLSCWRYAPSHRRGTEETVESERSRRNQDGSCVRYNAAFLAACCTHLHLPPSLLPLVQGLAASVAASIYTQGIDTISCRSWMTRWSREGGGQTSRPVVPIK